jgi:predicted transcriptional regulator
MAKASTKSKRKLMDNETIIDEPQTDWWDEIPQAAQKSILKGLEDVEAGRVHSHYEVMKPYEKWL